MSSVTNIPFPTTLAYYGAGIIGIFTLASFTMKKILGCIPWTPSGRDYLSVEEGEELRQQLSRKEVEITELRSSLSAAEDRSRRTARELEVSRKEVEAEHVNRTRTDSGKMAREVLGGKEALEHELEIQVKELAASRKDTNKAQEALAQMKTSLSIQSAELKVAQTFQSIPDRYAGADVLGMIETLNSEILRTASIMADVFAPDLQHPGTVVGDNEAGKHEAAMDTEAILGESVTKMLQTFNHQEENIILQIAFQALMVELVCRKHTSSCEKQRNSPCLQVAHFDSQICPPDLSTIKQQDLTYRILAACANILIISGLHESEQRLLNRLAARFSDRLTLIVERAMHLNDVIGDDITSCEFVPIYCFPAVPFEPSTMENATDNGSPGGGYEAVFVPNENKILCTTDLGLLRAEKVQGEERTWDNTVLLRPKIVMPSGLTISPTSSESPDWKTPSFQGEQEES
ncbi:hypothetical protein DFJ43DRAFT_1155255 [Lentinula guzmanii]|uniref:Uncharacterized protein n=1 Tax=Lentinula guzmanii TaxID=2804957 RepID=A0AA38JAU0_9AGAR|nr:hypothetical protein DFJ43DRAFT_1155255 [Lentinula guzmanii]